MSELGKLGGKDQGKGKKVEPKQETKETKEAKVDKFDFRNLDAEPLKKGLAELQNRETPFTLHLNKCKALQPRPALLWGTYPSSHRKEVIDALINLIIKNPANLKELSLRDNHITAQEAQEIFNALAINKGISNLDLHNNHLGTQD